jgi:hypothetical protein
VFAGTVDDPFWIDLGATFDSLNFRSLPKGTGFPGVLTKEQDADDKHNFASDDVAGFNVNAIAIEVPIALLTYDGKTHAANDPLATIGTWGTTSRPQAKAYRRPGEPAAVSERVTQIQRMGNPLFNELLIGTGDKDKFSMSQPKDDKQFANYALDPLFARVLNAIYKDALPIPAPPRTDLLPLVTYMAAHRRARHPGRPGRRPAAAEHRDRAHLRRETQPFGFAGRRRGGLSQRPAGIGRRDRHRGPRRGRRAGRRRLRQASRTTASATASTPTTCPYRESFPYLGLAHSGRDSRHVDPGEPGCATEKCPVD